MTRDPIEPQNRQAEADRNSAKLGENAVGVYQYRRHTSYMMSRTGSILMAVALVSALLAVPLGVAAVAADEPVTTDSVAPGERLAGVVGIQQAAVDGDLSERRHAVRLDRADTDAERAAIVDERRAEIEQRLADHRTELAELRAAREAGNLSEGSYRAQVATVAAETAATERAAERATDTASGLPEEVLSEQGVDTDDLDVLRAEASDLGGGETAAIAREIGGPNATTTGVGRTGGPPGESGAEEPPTRGSGATPGEGETPADDRPTDNPAERGESAETPGNEPQSPEDRGSNATAGRDGDTESGNGRSERTDRGGSSGTDQDGSGGPDEQDPRDGTGHGGDPGRGPDTGGQPPQ